MKQLLIIPSLILLSAISGCDEPQAVIAREEPVRPVRLFRVKAGNTVTTRTYVARTDAVQTVDLSFQVGGSLRHLPVKEGQLITAGEVIASLETKDFERAEEEAQVQLKLSIQDLQRKRSMLTQQGISKSLVDGAVATYNLRRLALEKAQEDLRDSELLAPFDAYVSRRFVDNYINVRPGDAIVRLLDLTETYVKVNVTEDLLATVAADQVAGVYVRFPFAPERRFELIYRENSNEAEQVAQTYEITFAMPRPDDINLLPGMTGTVEVALYVKNAAPTIPASALLPGDDGSFSVWIYQQESGRVSRKPVQTGSPVGNQVTILAGLNGGEQILSAGVFHAREGMQVRPMN